MTTYTFNGLSRQGDGASERLAPTSLSVVLPDAVDQVFYTGNGTIDGLPTFVLQFAGGGQVLNEPYQTTVGGQVIGDDYFNIVLQVTGGPYAGAVFYDFYDAATDIDHFFLVNGPFPPITTAEEIDAFAASGLLQQLASVIGPPTGDFAPGQRIDLATMPNSSLTEVDRFRGDADDETFSLGRGNDRVWGRGGDDDIEGGAGRDKLWGDTGNDTLAGGSGKDTLLGGGGRDRLNGGTGNDRLEGGSSKDSLFGGSGNDTLKGGSGRDKIYGERGNDLINGGGNADTIVFAKNGGHDTIEGFTNNVDTLAINGNVLRGALTKDRIMNRAEQEGDDVVITFNPKTSITIEGFDLDGLRNDLAIV